MKLRTLSGSGGEKRKVLAVDILTRFQQWFLDSCDDEWEHLYGLKIENLDNPGWTLKVHLNGTYLEGRPLDHRLIDRSEHDWIECRVEDRTFKGSGGPLNLAEILEAFLDWASKDGQPGDLRPPASR